MKVHVLAGAAWVEEGRLQRSFQRKIKTLEVMGSLRCPFVGGNLMEVATVVADGVVSWITVTVEILDCQQTRTHTLTSLNLFTRFTVRWRQRDRTGKCLFAWDLRH